MENFVITSICRLCAAVKDHVFRIYDEEGYKLAIEMKIEKYLHIQIGEKDSLPKNVCWECYAKLEEFSNFVDICQNAQITLSQKIFSVFSADNNLKEHIFPHDLIFDNASNLQSFNSKQVEENIESSGPFDCDDLNLESTSNSCYFNNKTSDCLFEDRSKNNETLQNITAEDNVISVDCNKNSPNLRKRLNKRKSVNPVRYLSNNSLQVRTNKRKLCNKNIGGSKRKKIHVGGSPDEDYCESESEEFKEKYFHQIPWICTSCEEKFQTLTELKNHHTDHHLQPPRYMCPHCYKIYMQYHGFVSHLKKFQCNVDFQCESCPKIFSNKKLLDMHRRVHVKNPPYQCSYCEKSFKHQSGLYAHTRCHLPDHLKTEFSCDQCDKFFSTMPNLVTHKKIHTGLKNYVCDLCGKSFVQKGNLSAHMLTHSDNKPFNCENCQKKFKTLMQLQKHNNIHTGKKPHQCDICGRTFRERSTLKEHYRIHTGDMPFSCEFCGKAFRFKGVLTTHRRQHTGERPYSCLECQHHFTNWPNYNKHMKRRHGINKSKASHIKLDNISQNSIPQNTNGTVTIENTNQSETTSIEIPSFDDTLQLVPKESVRTVSLFDETAPDSLLAAESCLNDPAITQQQTSTFNAYFNLSTLQLLNTNQQLTDTISSSVMRDFI